MMPAPMANTMLSMYDSREVRCRSPEAYTRSNITMNSPRCKIGICGFACSKYSSTRREPSSRSGKGACFMVGLVWSPKKESRIEVPLSTTLVAALAPRLLPRSEEEPDTELLTAANTTRAKDMPDVEPRYLGSLAPCTETMPMFDTSLVSFSRSYLSLSSLAWAAVGLVLPLRGCGAADMGRGVTEPPLDTKAGLKSSASWKGIEFSRRRFSRYAIRVSQ